MYKSSGNIETAKHKSGSKKVRNFCTGNQKHYHIFTNSKYSKLFKLLTAIVILLQGKKEGKKKEIMQTIGANLPDIYCCNWVSSHGKLVYHSKTTLLVNSNIALYIVPWLNHPIK